MLTRYQLDLDKSEAAMHLLRDQLDHVAREMDQARHERHQAVDEAKKTSSEKLALEKNMQELTRQYGREREEIMTQQSRQLQTLQAQWEKERDLTTQELLTLKKAQVDLQVCTETSV